MSQGEIPPPHVQMLQMISAFWLSRSSTPPRSWDWQTSCANSRARTEAEFRSLYDAAGFRLTRVVHTASPMSIVEGEPL